MARGFQRARRPEQKEQRRGEIVAATAGLLDEVGLQAVSLSGIARRAGLAKSNLYRYFESREEILLHLLYEDWRSWVEAVELGLAPLAARDDIEGVAVVLTEAAVARPRMCELASVVSSVLEQNLTEEAVVGFKRQSVGIGLRMINALHAALPALPLDACRGALAGLYALLAGLWAHANPPPMVAKVLKRPELKLFVIDFAESLAEASAALLRGYALASASRRAGTQSSAPSR